MLAKVIKDYPEFDKNKHHYVIAMAGGDGEIGSYPIANHIEKDKRMCADNERYQSEIDMILSQRHGDWVDMLEVYDNEDNLVAQYDVYNDVWNSV